MYLQRVSSTEESSMSTTTLRIHRSHPRSPLQRRSIRPVSRSDTRDSASFVGFEIVTRLIVKRTSVNEKKFVPENAAELSQPDATVDLLLRRNVAAGKKGKE